ncbi:MAG TPA: hypothetical protein VG986_17220 [Pseudolabrys sp.]|nr:hypothetical protein [Pseudolabrys sp.]
MARMLLVALLLTVAAAPARADNYPISGRFGQSTGTTEGTIDCKGKRVMSFSGGQRTDSKGGVPGYHNKWVTPDGPGRFRVVDMFTTGQQAFAYANYTLHVIDNDHIELNLHPGGTIKLQRCK